MAQPDASSWAGPLHGVRVLDFTRVLSGPSASLALADLGAEVWKVEPPGGDETRHFPPFRDGESHYYLAVNRGKKSIVLDLKTEQGAQIARDLATRCDILLENYRPGVMDRLGLGYERLAELNPGLIYCAISGFGVDSPLRDRPSFDIVLQALSGAMSVNGHPGAPPTKLGIPLGDLIGGVNAPIAVLAALHERHATGKGRFVDISLLDGMLGMLGYLAQMAFFTGEDPQPQGSEHPNLVPYGAFPARDGSIIIACLTNSFWERICKALGRLSWIGDPRFDTIEKRRDRREELNGLISEITSEYSMDELVALFVEHQVPHAPILGIREALAQPHAQAREMLVQAQHKTLGSIPLVGRPFHFDGERQVSPEAPPVLGQHTDEILSEVLEYDATQIEALRSAGVVL